MLVTIEESLSDSDERLKSLFHSLSQDDLEPLGELYDRLASRIYGLALWQTGSTSDASDVVQEVFVKLATRRKQLGAVKNPLSYVLGMAHHASVDLLRKRNRESPIDELILISESNQPRDEVERLHAAVSELPSDQRAAVYLRYLAGFTLREVASATGVGLFTAATRCRLALKKLRERLGDQK